MARYEHVIRSLETDIFNNVKPKTLLRLAIDSVSGQSDLEGVSFARMKEETGAVWMLARLKFCQFEPICGEQKIHVDVSRRSISAGTYVRVIEFRTQEEVLAVRCTMASMAVNSETRHILRSSSLENMFTAAQSEVQVPAPKRIRVREELPELGRSLVRFGDCDMNGHLSGPAYADIVCEALGYWEGGAKVFTSLQIDYSAECPPGKEIVLRGKCSENDFIMQGMRHDGVLSFTAAGSFRSIDS